MVIHSEKENEPKQHLPEKEEKSPEDTYSNELMLHDYYAWVDRTMTLKGPAE